MGANPDTVVVGVAILRDGRVLAARRPGTGRAPGGWELPGGKVEPGESPSEAAVREVQEELGCVVRVTGALPGESHIRPGLVLRVLTALLVAGEPVAHEHAQLRWLRAEELLDVQWLEPDVPFLPALAERLLSPGWER